MRALLLVCMLAQTTLSCKKQKDDQSRINNDLRITMVEDSSDVLRLLVKTEERFPCSNYSIDFARQARGNEITIQFNHVQLYNHCLTAFGPATNDIVLGQLQPGNYSLVLKCNGKEQSVPLTVTGAKYTVTNASGKFFSFTNTEITR